MFDYMGEKIKGLGKVYCWIGIVASVIAGIAIVIAGGVLGGVAGALLGLLIGAIYAAIGSVLSWVSCFVLIGYGELVDNTETITYMIAKSLNTENTNGNIGVSNTWVCANCGHENSNNFGQCKKCGQNRS